MRERFSDQNRLLFNFAVIIFMFICTGGLTLYGLFSLGSLTESIYSHPLIVSNASLRAAVHMTKMHRDMKDVVLSSTEAERNVALSRVAMEEMELHRQLDLVRDNIVGNTGKRLEQQTRQMVDEWEPVRHKVVMLMEQGQQAAAIRISQHHSARHVTKLERKMFELTRYARKKADGYKRTAEEQQQMLQRLTLAITALAVLLAIFIAFVATRRVTRAHTCLEQERNHLERAMAEIKTLRGIIPVCANCRQIRDDEGIWKALEQYLDEHFDASVSHGICPACVTKLYPDMADKINSEMERRSEDRNFSRS